MVFGRIIVIFICAIFGAVFGYILGRIVELFPGLNLALTGMSGMSMPALLAAIGLMAGVILGLLASLASYFVCRGAEKWRQRGRLRRIKHSFKHGDAYGWKTYCGAGCYGGEYGLEPHSIEDTLQEIDSYLSYLEDLPKDQLAAHEDRMGRFSDRLDSLRASLHR